jgi:hypothetical protein
MAPPFCREASWRQALTWVAQVHSAALGRGGPGSLSPDQLLFGWPGKDVSPCWSQPLPAFPAQAAWEEVSPGLCAGSSRSVLPKTSRALLSGTQASGVRAGERVKGKE